MLSAPAGTVAGLASHTPAYPPIPEPPVSSAAVQLTAAVVLQLCTFTWCVEEARPVAAAGPVRSMRNGPTLA